MRPPALTTWTPSCTLVAAPSDPRLDISVHFKCININSEFSVSPIAEKTKRCIINLYKRNSDVTLAQMTIQAGGWIPNWNLSKSPPASTSHGKYFGELDQIIFFLGRLRPFTQNLQWYLLSGPTSSFLTAVRRHRFQFRQIRHARQKEGSSADWLGIHTPYLFKAPPTNTLCIGCLPLWRSQH